MSRDDLSRIFDHFESIAVGFGPVFRNFQTLSTSYPPHNVIKRTDNLYILEIAVAGFKKQEISVTEHQGDLIITGTRSMPDEDASQYQHRGIGKRSFEKKFKLAEFMEITDARLADGLLSMTLMRNVPDEAKPKVITIK